MLFSTCSQDDAIGPVVLGCRDGFDFTVKFEQIFLSLVPSVIFIVLSVWRICLMARKPTVIDAPLLQLTKLSAITTYVGLQLSLLILVGVRSFNVTSLAIGCAVSQLLAALCMACLSLFDHSKNPRPSVLLNAYLFITILLDVTETRTFWLASGTKAEQTYTCIFTAGIAVKALILLLEAQRKAKWVMWDAKEHSPEETSGIYSLGVFFWLNSLFLDGYRKILQIRDLYPLDQSMGGESLHRRFSKHLDYEKLKRSKYGLLQVLARTLVTALLLPIPARLALLGFNFCQPFFISRLLDYLSHLSGPDTTASANVGYGLIGASVAIYTGIAISNALYGYFHQRMLYMARGCLVTAIYTKAVEASNFSGDEGAPLTLMSSDIERIIIGFDSLHDIWAAFIETGIAGWLLYTQLGAAFVTPLVVVLVCVLSTTVLVRYTGPSQKAWMEAVQRRVSLTATVIGNVKNLKISGLTTPVTEFVQNLRVDELASGSRSRKLSIMAALIAFVPLLVTPFITFGVAARKGLNATRLFTSLSFLLLMANPLQTIFQSIPMLIAGLACLSRIQAYLESETRKQRRATLDSAREDSEKQSKDVPTSTTAIEVRNGSYGWEASKIVLDNVNLEVPNSALTIIVGPIGSGKSTLLKALLGEIPFNQGSITMGARYARVGYCDQSAFLYNGSVRDNIVGFSPLDPTRYSEVIEATMLAFDLEKLPLGDHTNIGSNGITLSGGQKQRVALARSLYLQSDLLVFDDVFSGLDADTEDQIFRQVFGPDGLIRRRHATAVLCTHSIRHLPAADHIVALGNGTVVEQGTFQDLMANERYVHSLGVKSSDSDTPSDVAESSVSMQSQPDLLRQATTASSVLVDNDKSRQIGDSTVYKLYFQSMGLLLAGSLFFWAAVLGFFYNFPNIWLTYWSTDVVSQNPKHSNALYAGIYALLQISCLLSLMTLATLLHLVAIKRSGASLHWNALNTLINASLAFFTKTDQGTVLNLFSQDLNLIDNDLPNALLNVLFTVSVSIGQACVMITSSPFIAISYPFLIALLWVVQRFYLRTSRQLRLLDLEAKSPLYTHFLDTSKGIVTLRAFGFISEDRKKNIHLLDNSQRPAYLLVMIQRWLTLVLNFVVMGMAVLLTVLAIKTRGSNGFTGGAMVTLMQFGESLSGIVIFYTRLETSIAAIARLKSFDANVKPENRDDEDIIPAEDWPQRGDIELKGVSASYDTEDSQNDELPNLALRQINLTIAPGERIAICGRTGSGKSSILALLLKLLDPLSETPANVYINKVPLHRLDRPTLRRRIIAVPQDAVFLPDGSTFQENLDPFDHAGVPECQSVLETVDLWSFVRERGGLQAGMSPGTLSQGQRQLFSLARAVLRRRIRARSLGLGGGGSEGGILLLDEVTSSVDQEMERAMQEIIRVEFKEYTVVAVSHRLDMIMDFDRVVVMDQGEIAEVGNPRALSGSEGTRFGDLWKAGGN
ncbi:putative ABC multidrug transporter [Pseudomassariella vexata]|uniref:Putative ABC multidrug transporter n=1 Tax=Pseudomassariella vexata TaxID=1141098 RepID=A0A1Y2DQ63_9PEZI|nr:putative ABC multidrug transporter [Pseudomassariella vexata]ORY61431.1 putative ABC multidrug transporter [Pseudomassariella vexata]